MRRSAMAGMLLALIVVGMMSGRARAIYPILTAEYVGANGGYWTDANAWEILDTNTVGNSATILGRNGGNNGLNNINVTLSHARHAIIPANTTVNFDGDIDGLRWNRGSDLTIKNGAVWQQLADATYEENSWSVTDGKLTIDGGSMLRKEIAPSSNPDGPDGPGLWIFGSYRDDENLGRLGKGQGFDVEIKNGGYLENDGQLWFGADDEHTLGNRGKFTINDGDIKLNGGSFTYQNSTLFVNSALAFFYDYYRDELYADDGDPNPPNPDVDPAPQPKNEEWEINFTGPGSITVDAAGIWVYRQNAAGVWDEGAAGPLSYQDLWNQGILKAHGLSGKTGIIPRETNSEIALTPANFNEYFTVSGTPGLDDYTLTSIVTPLQEVKYVGANGGYWTDANAWQNTTTSAIGNSATILGRTGGSNGLNNISVAASHARVVTIPAGVTVNYDGDIDGLRWNRGSTLIIEEGAVWQQLADATYEENSWSVFDGKLVIDGGSMLRKEIAPSSNPDGPDGPGLWIFGSYRDDENLQRLGQGHGFDVEIKNGGYLENDGQLWFGADDEHTLGNRGKFTINDGDMKLNGGSFTYQNSTLFVNSALAFFFDYYRDDLYADDGDPNPPNPDVDPAPQPKNEEWEINFTGPGSITVDAAGIWVYRQNAAGTWDEGAAGPLSYEDLWNQGILQAFGLSGKTGIIPRETNGEIALEPALFSTYFTTSGTPGMDDYILTSLIEATPDFEEDDADYNDDGTIDAADYVLWRKIPGTYGGDPGGYDAWKETFGSASPGAGGGGVGGVPEPGAMLLMLLGLASVSMFKRQSR